MELITKYNYLEIPVYDLEKYKKYCTKKNIEIINNKNYDNLNINELLENYTLIMKFVLGGGIGNFNPSSYFITTYDFRFNFSKYFITSYFNLSKNIYIRHLSSN